MLTLSNGFAPGCDVAKELWPEGCQSWVSATIEVFGETIDDRYHSVAIGDRKRSTGTEIVLHVDYQQQIFVVWPLHPGPVFVAITEL
jgi:hypothetical protein